MRVAARVTVFLKVFTEQELIKFDGKSKDESEPIYLVVVGQVYDVSKGRQYYSEGSGYNVFAGKVFHSMHQWCAV